MQLPIFFQFEIDVRHLYPHVTSFESLATDFVKDVITAAIKVNTGKKNEVLFRLVRDHTDAGMDLSFVSIISINIKQQTSILSEIFSIKGYSVVDGFASVLSYLYGHNR